MDQDRLRLQDSDPPPSSSSTPSDGSRPKQSTTKDLVFPNRDGGIWDPHNFNRLWRQARGEKFSWVTPKTFRKTVASLIADQYWPQAAARQLGHANDSVTKRHYIDQPTEAPDFTAALGHLAG